ncbi:uncharacterized protein LOC129774211 [Toxorhynchites rutilus septentrionalis]|uniref:uncharacterized protein LOC129774211 n=1 Tax=Toxorhynchites rutilus septentrionalis TaxID=329112 RepID=UPI0024790767|nr:uncharacterized protein LOC129774211 [Toxorhynchites rutilus septentrionalis]
MNDGSQIDSFSNPLLSGIELSCNVFFIHQDSILNFMDQFIECHDEATYRNSDKTIILLMDNAQPNEENLLEQISGRPNLVEVMNLLILKPIVNMDSIDLLTHRLVGLAEESTDLLLLDVFDVVNETFRYGAPLFPDKSSNLLGKPIRLATFNVTPHVFIEKGETSDPLVKLGNDGYQIDGIGVLLMVEFCRRYNCSIELVFDEINMWGKVNANKTGDGVLGNLVERRADIGIGALHTWYEYLKYLSFSKLIQRNSVSCFVPKPKLRPAWKDIYFAFSVPVWYSTVVVFSIIVFIHHSIDRLNLSKIDQRSIARNCLNLWAIFLQQTAYIRRRTVSDVVLSVTLLVFTFNLVNIYSSRFSSLKTIPTLLPSIDTLDDQARSGLSLLQTHEACVFSLILLDNPIIQTLLSRFQARSPSILRLLADEGNTAFLIGRLNNGHFMIGEWITTENVHNYQLMRDDLIFSNPNDLLAELNILSPIPIVILELNGSSGIILTDDPLLTGIDLGCDSFIVHQDSIINFMDQFIVSHDEATYRNPDKTVILLMDGVQVVEQSLLEALRDHPNLVEIMKLLILKPSANMEAIELLTHRFVGTVEESIDLLQLDTFDIPSNTFRYGKHLFPNKTSNLRGKPIRVTTFNIPPFVILRKNEYSDPLVKSGNQIYQMDGVDGQMMVEFCRRYNCSMELQIEDVDMWGRINANGVFGNLVERQSDVGLGALGNWNDPFKYLIFSKPLQKGGITCLTPKPTLLPSWRVMLIAFSIPVWILTFLVFFIIVFLHLLMDRLNQTEMNQQNIARNFLNLLAIFLQQTVNIRKPNPSGDILNVMLLMFTFNLVNTYSSRNASLKTIPLFGPSIDTIEDLAQSDLIWLQMHDTWTLSLYSSENPTIIKLISKFRAESPPMLRELADQGNVAFAIARSNNGNLMIGEWITAENIHKYQVMKEDLFYNYDIFMATKTWPLMEQVNMLAMRTVEANIRQYQELNVIYKYGDYYVQTVVANSRLREPNAHRPLNVTDILVGFFALGARALLAIIAFVMENSSFKSKRKISKICF